MIEQPEAPSASQRMVGPFRAGRDSLELHEDSINRPSVIIRAVMDPSQLQVPSGETIGAIEARIGRRPVVVFLWLGFTALALGFLTIILTSIRSGFGFLAPYLPLGGWQYWASGGAVLAVYTGGFIYVFWKLRGLAHFGDLQTRINKVESLAAEANRDIASRVDRHEERIRYVESQIGDEMLNFLVDRQLREKGFMLGSVQREVTQLGSEADRERLKKMQRLLFEIVQTARDRAEATDDFEKLAKQGWVLRQISIFVTRHLAPNQYIDFNDFLDLQRKQLEANGRKGDARALLMEVAAYFERLIPELRPEDMDPEHTLPVSFKDFMANP